MREDESSDTSPKGSKRRKPEMVFDNSAAKPDFSIKFIPDNVPHKRRMQTAAVAFWFTLLPLSLSVFFLFGSVALFWPLLIAYIIWMCFDDAPNHGGRISKRMRKHFIWKLCAGYFPVSLIKSADLPADRKYVFGYHPHGIIGMGAICNFGTEATGFSEKFPGLKPHLLTLATNFNLPIYRDILMSMGICSVAYKSCRNILRQGPGSALTIVVGGAAESLAAHPGTADLTLKRRLGFIKLAIKEGADLVPVFSFGENDIFAQLANEKGSKLYKLQKKFQAVFGFTLPAFHGRGALNYTIGLLPYRHPIVSVVGRPIRVEQNDAPSLEVMEEIQRQYIEELFRIWDEYKDMYAINRRRELSIVE